MILFLFRQNKLDYVKPVNEFPNFRNAFRQTWPIETGETHFSIIKMLLAELAA